MIRPKNFGYNPQTAVSNSFQNETNKDVRQQAVIEFEQAHEILVSKGIEVKVFNDQDALLPDAIFPNNWISHVPNESVVVYPMLTENRRAEVRTDVIEWMSQFLNERVMDIRGDYSRILEGTGSIVFDHQSKTAFACVSPRTNLSLLRDFSSQIGYTTLSFESVDVNGGQIYHTNVVMSLGEDIGIICLESIQDLLERSMVKAHLEKIGKKVLEISYHQMNHFAGNALEVINKEGERFYVMSTTAYESLNDDQIEAIEASTEIIQIDIPTIEQIGGGSIRCMMAGLFNYPK
jgi:hypothetical protein